MSAALLGRIYSTQLNEEIDWQTLRITGGVQEVYLVTVTDDCEDETSVMNVDGLPTLGQRHASYPRFFVSSRSASESSEGRVWTVTISYDSPQKDRDTEDTEDPGQSNGETEPLDPTRPPWDQPWSVQYGSQRKQSLKTRMVYLGAYSEEVAGDFTPQVFPWLDATKIRKDRFGNPLQPVTNSVGEPIYFDGERILQTYTVESSHREPTYPKNWLPRIGTINRSPQNFGLLGTLEPGTVLLEDTSIQQQWWQSPADGKWNKYYSMNRKFVIDPLGHWVEMADVGSLHFEGGARSLSEDLSDAVRALDAGGNPTVYNLNGFGGKAADGSAPVFLRYVPYPVGDW